jgi:cytochrome c oxidase subunit IV
MAETLAPPKPHGEGGIVPTRVYYAVFAALMVLTLLTTGVAFLDLGFFSPVVALTIAIVKASLVALFFMHLRYSSRLTWVVAGAGIFWLGILLVLSASDYMTRAWGRI